MAVRLASDADLSLPLGIIGSCVLHILALIGFVWLGARAVPADNPFAGKEITWVELPAGGGTGLLDLPEESLLPARGESIEPVAAPVETSKDEPTSDALPELTAETTPEPPKPEPKPEPAKPAPKAGDIRGSGPGYGAPGGSGGDGGTGPGSGQGLGGKSTKLLFQIDQFPFVWYQARVEDKLRAAWRKPSEARQISAKVGFLINRDGTMEELQIMRRSGVKRFDDSVLRACEDAAPFPPLPAAFLDDQVAVIYTFETTR